MLRHLIVCLLILLVLTGCAMGPDYIRPEIMLPLNSDNASTQAQFTATDWWKLFNDPTLDRIEAEALAFNRDLKIAMARVDEARALAQIGRAHV